MIAKVISGGQTGVDIAALRAAKRIGIATGGTMPAGWRTLDGPRPEWAAEFGLVAHWSSAYPRRTFANVKEADVTVRIALDFASAGERLTAKAVSMLRRPEDLEIQLRRRQRALVCEDEARDVPFMVACLRRHRDRLRRDLIVNFAGNSEKTAPGIERAAEEIVYEILGRCQR